ncbi:thermonuclease family protein [Comamonas testosteroni]|uniref:thermonuclease family protein n=1 Tax=Comamonas testosteroni TaxID=285 RepID=UPI0026EDD3E7|nr:thermonuclease family protein [Comamonas testosteroni]
MPIDREQQGFCRKRKPLRITYDWAAIVSNKSVWISTVLALAAGTFAFGAKAESWTLTGKVIYASDGDTLVLMLDDYTKVNIRMSDIDAPESGHGQKRPGQPYSRVSMQSLSALAKGKLATATCYEIDNPKFNRPVCTVFVNGVNLNAEQVRQGLAWANRANPRYLRDQQILMLEQQARASGRGIWSKDAPRPVEPWIWRDLCWKKNACTGAGE